LNNAIKHAQATSVLIRILHNASSAEVIIEDDGVGFNVKTVKKGAGLKNMQNRIYLINGEHIIESTPNQGSKIIIKFPIIQTKNLYPL
jgi:signal transduction histidine kinase